VTYVLDTSALKWAYLDGTKFCRRIRYITSRFKGNVHVAEITVLEIVNALGSWVRGKRISVAQFASASDAFLQDVADGKLVVVPLPTSEYVPCRGLLTLVGVDAGRNLETQDAMVAYTARRLALDRVERVKLLTSDRKLATIVAELSIFKGLVEPTYLNPN
jgi:hypothetical protein